MRFLLLLTFVFAAPSLLALELDGQTDFSRRLDLNSSVSARVETIFVLTGQQVEQGELLMQLETTELQSRVDISRAEVEAQAPAVERMLTELEKAQELFDRDSLALVELQRAEQDHQIARARLKAAEARLARAEYRLDQAQVRAPFSGVVLAVNATPGLYVNTRIGEQTLLTLADNITMSATALVPLERWRDNLLHRNAKLSYRNQTYRGRVSGVGHRIDTGENNHPAMRLEVEFDADGKIPAGLAIKIRLDDQ